MSRPESMLTADRVRQIFFACLFKEGEDLWEYIRTPGIGRIACFHPGRIEEHKAEIIALLDELPDEFKESIGAGASFLNACNDRHGKQWTGLHLRMEQLFQLGIATGKASCLTPRDKWREMPGGMPYYVVNSDLKMVVTTAG